MVSTITDVFAAASLLVLLVALAVLFLWFRDRVTDARRRRYYTPERRAAERASDEARILHPNWEFYERHLGRPAPQALRELYADRDLVTAQDIEFDDYWAISTFESLDEESALDTLALLGFDALPIAMTDCGDPIYLRPGARQQNTVYVTSHDGGETEIFAPSVEAMLLIIRDKRRAPN